MASIFLLISNNEKLFVLFKTIFKVNEDWTKIFIFKGTIFMQFSCIKYIPNVIQYIRSGWNWDINTEIIATFTTNNVKLNNFIK